MAAEGDAPTTVTDDGSKAVAPQDPLTETPAAPAASAAAPGKKGKAKTTKGKEKAPKVNPKVIKAQIDALKGQLTEATKATAAYKAQAAQIRQGDDEARSQMKFYALEESELTRQLQLAQQECEDLRTLLANREREVEEVKETSAAELRALQQKVKHLMTANQHQFAQAHVEGESDIFMDRKRQQLALADQERTVAALRSDANDLELRNKTLMTAHRTVQDRQFTQLREIFEREVAARRAEHEQRVKAKRAQLEEQRVQETSELEARKNEQIRRLQARNAEAFDRIQHYFSGITHNNLDVIKQSKGKIAHKKVAINQLRKEVEDLNTQRKRLEQPLQELTADIERKLKEIEVYKQDKRDLARNKALIKKKEEELADLELAKEVLDQRLEQLEAERDELYAQFEEAIHDVRQKAEFRAYVLEEKARRLQTELEQREMQLQQVMQRAGLDSTAISAKIDDVVAIKNARINELETELAKVQRAHMQILALFEEKMAKYGIPHEEIGFQADIGHPGQQKTYVTERLD